jgi:2-methylcitrate dehydratase PrpD
VTAAPDALEHDLGFLRAISPHGAVDTASPARLGRDWRILATGINIKLYPMCYAAHRSLDAMLDLCRTHALRGADIASVTVEIGDSQAAILRNHRPQSVLAAKFSAEFAMAAAALAGGCGAAELDQAFVTRPDVQAFLERVRIETTAARDPEEPALAPFDRVRVVLRDGRQLESEPVAWPRGHFRRPVGADALWDKFRDCTADVLPPARARTLFDALGRLPLLRGPHELAPQAALA